MYIVGRMRKILTTKIGEDAIWTSCSLNGNAAIIVGTFNVHEKYGIMLEKINFEGKIHWKKHLEIKCNCEANSILRNGERYIIAGNACGIPTKFGGMNWKAYIIEVDNEGNKLSERIYKLGENDAIYSLQKVKNGIIGIGETQINNKKYIFLIKINKQLELLESKLYGPYTDIIIGGISENIIGFSFQKNKRWYGLILEIDENLNTTREIAKLDDVLIYSLYHVYNEIYLSGEKQGQGYVAKILKDEAITEKIMPKGVITKIKAYGDRIIGVGDNENSLYISVLNDSLNLVYEHLEKCVQGWFEDVCFNEHHVLAIGYSLKHREAIALILENRNLFF